MVEVNDGVILPHSLFRIILQRGSEGIKFPLTEVSHGLMNILKNRKMVATTINDKEIKGSSWEMACIMSLLGYNGVFTGSIRSIKKKGNALHITFDKVKGLKQKKKIHNEIYTAEEIPYVLLPL